MEASGPMMPPRPPAVEDPPAVAVADPHPGGHARPFHPLPWVVLATLLLAPSSFRYLVEDDALQNWATVFLSVTMQAVPFLVLGVLVSAALASLVPASLLVRALPRRSVLSVPVAGLAGAVLPGCECSSVPVAGRLVSAGVPPAAGLTFLLAAPAINPVVLVATSVAFPGRPEMVVARFAASLATAMVVGFLAQRLGLTERLLSRMKVLGHG